MVTFETALDPTSWTEILMGGTFVAFDILSAQEVEVYLNETGVAPDVSDKGNLIFSHPPSYDFEATGCDAGVQRIWVRGRTSIRGIRD